MIGSAVQTSGDTPALDDELIIVPIKEFYHSPLLFLSVNLTSIQLLL